MLFPLENAILIAIYPLLLGEGGMIKDITGECVRENRGGSY